MDSAKGIISGFNKRSRVNKSKIIRKRSEDKSSSEDETYIVKNRKTGHRNDFLVKKVNNRRICVNNADEVLVSYKSDRSYQSVGRMDQGATSVIQTETEVNKDAQAIFERSLKIRNELKGKVDDKIYRGLSTYVNNYETNESVSSLKLIHKGPIRAPANIRTTCQWDYQPDICKDYKETGFCGFGDSCKFLHDRSDYKYGWEIEQNMKNSDICHESINKYEIPSSSDEEDKLPFRCYICRNSFINPVVTKCYHYFCEKCALNNFKANSKCFICNKQTNGIFKPANKLIQKLTSKRE